jgi:pyrroloquinoline quinone biosynthesis protein E
LQGIGEPTLQRDDLYEMIKYARASHIWVRTTTNASLLHLNDNYKKLIDADTNEVQISIDGADAETFEAIRRGGVFKQVAANCKLINDYQKAKGVCRTKMWTVVQRGNVHQLEALVDLAAELGFASHVMAFNVNDWGLEGWKERKERLSARDLIGLERMLALVDRGTAQGVAVQYWDTIDTYGTETPEKLCPWPFERAYFSSDKRIVPCCFIANPDTYEFDGSAEGLSRVWNGEAYAEFRQAHLDGRIPQICKACYGQ